MQNKLKKTLEKSHFAGAEHAIAIAFMSPQIIQLEYWDKAHSGEEEHLYLIYA